MKKVIFILVLFLASFAMNASEKEQSVEYYASGVVKSKVIKHDNFAEVVKYYESGNIEEREFFDLDKNKIGCWIRYYENGTVMSTANFKNNKKNGEWKSYDAEGKLVVYIKYKNGKRKTVCMVTEDKGLAVK